MGLVWTSHRTLFKERHDACLLVTSRFRAFPDEVPSFTSCFVLKNIASCLEGTGLRLNKDPKPSGLSWRRWLPLAHRSRLFLSPESWLSCRSRIFSLLRLPISAGMAPDFRPRPRTRASRGNDGAAGTIKNNTICQQQQPQQPGGRIRERFAGGRNSVRLTPA